MALNFEQPIRKIKSMNFNSTQNPDGSIDLLTYLGVKDEFYPDLENDKQQLDFENWKLIKIIGKGAYAKVYLV